MHLTSSCSLEGLGRVGTALKALILLGLTAGSKWGLWSKPGHSLSEMLGLVGSRSVSKRPRSPPQVQLCSLLTPCLGKVPLNHFGPDFDGNEACSWRHRAGPTSPPPPRVRGTAPASQALPGCSEDKFEPACALVAKGTSKGLYQPQWDQQDTEDCPPVLALLRQLQPWGQFWALTTRRTLRG